MTDPRPPLVLRDLHLDDGLHSILEASLTADGSLLLAAQDLGGPAFLMNPDGEYEYWRTIAPEDLPALIALVGGEPGEEILTVLARDWTGARSFDLEALLREAPFPLRFFGY